MSFAVKVAQIVETTVVLVMRRFKLGQEREFIGIRYPNVTRRFVILCLLAGLGLVAAISMYRSYATTQVPGGSPRAEASSDGWAGANVREVQEKLRERDFYSGEIDGVYNRSDCAWSFVSKEVIQSHLSQRQASSLE